MAHRSNVIQVPIEFPRSDESKVVITDLYCGRKMPKKEAKHVLFRSGEPLFFCSRECLDKFRISGVSKARSYA